MFNVAADGWLDADDARALLPRSTAPALPQEALERALHRTWKLGVGDIPPGVVPYLVHPWVIANDKLKRRGLGPRHSNEDAIREALAALPARRTGRTRVVVLAVGGAAIVTGLRLRRRSRAVPDTPASPPPTPNRRQSRRIVAPL